MSTLDSNANARPRPTSGDTHPSVLLEEAVSTLRRAIEAPRWDAQLVQVSTPTRGSENSPMSAVTVGEEIGPAIVQALDALGSSEATEALRAAYQPGETVTLGSAFARLYSMIFAHLGVVLLDA